MTQVVDEGLSDPHHATHTSYHHAVKTARDRNRFPVSLAPAIAVSVFEMLMRGSIGLGNGRIGAGPGEQ